MEQWQDRAIILSVRPHGENGAVISLLTAEHGRQSGYVRGAMSSKNRGTLDIGNIVDAQWRSRVEGNLGSLTLELRSNPAARIMQDPLKLCALQSACAICDQALPEKEGHSGLYDAMVTLFEIMDGAFWAQGYVMWELSLLRELGFSLDLARCAAGGDAKDLLYVSPKSGRAVSRAAGEIYKEKLLLLPSFLNGAQARSELEEIVIGLKLTGFFLEHWAFAHHNRGIPEVRQRLGLRFAERFAKSNDQGSGNDTGPDTNQLSKELYGAR